MLGSEQGVELLFIRLGGWDETRIVIDIADYFLGCHKNHLGNPVHTGINPFLLGLLSPKSVRVRNIWDSYRNGQGWVHRGFIPACPANSLTMTAKKKGSLPC